MADYNSFNPQNIIICGGDENNERIDVSSDTSSTTISQLIVPRRGAFGCGNAANSWIIAGFNTETVERFDHSNFTAVLNPCADLPGILAGGATLYGNDHAFLCGSAFGPETYIFTLSTETGVATTDMPLRVRDCEGSCDTDVGWCPGGVLTDGTISESTQKITLATSTWSQVATLEITGGKARHNSLYRDHTLYLCGGIESNGGLTSKVISIDTSTDVATAETRCELSLGRDFVGGINNLEYGWSVGGANQGSQDIVDRFDFSNDTTNANVRVNLNHRRYYASCLGELEFSQGTIDETGVDCWCHNGDQFGNNRKGFLKLSLGLGPYTICDKFFLGGGQNYDVFYSTIDELDTSTDTITTEANTSLTARYSLLGFSNMNHTWFSCGFLDMDGTPTDVTERLDHANTITSVVPRTSCPQAFGNGSSVFFEEKGYGKFEEKGYELDFSTELWTALPDHGLEIFQAGCGIGPYAIFAGGTVGSERSNDIYKFDPGTTTWETAADILVYKRSGSAASANAENVWYAGGSRFGTTQQIERFETLNTTSMALSRSNLSSSKQRLSSSINQDYIWYTGGYRSGAIPDIDRFDYFNDTVTASYRGDMSVGRHSFADGGVMDSGTRTFCDRQIMVVTTQTTDVDSCHYGTRASTDTASYFYPIETKFDQRLIRYNIVPWQELSQRTCITKCGTLETSTINVCFSYATNTSMDCAYAAETPQATFQATGSSHSYMPQPYQPSTAAKIWIAGGDNMAQLEVVDQNSGWSARGELSLGRTSAAGISSLDEGWFGGGAVDNLIEHLDYTNDTATLTDRADLFINRSSLMATHNHQYGWFWSGEKYDGNLTGSIDRLDKSNDTIQTESRTHETGRKNSSGDCCCSLMYGIGGINPISNIDHVVSFSPENDTVLFSSNPFPKPVSSHTATSWDDNCMYIQHYSDIWKFDVSGGVFVVDSGAAYFRTNGTSFRLDDSIIYMGGSHSSYTKNTEKYDPVTSTMTTHGETLNNHNRCWCVGERAFITGATPTRMCDCGSVETVEDERTSDISSVSGSHNLPSTFYYAALLETEREGVLYGSGSCATTEGFGKTWVRSGVYTYVINSTCGTFETGPELLTSSTRSAAFSNSDYGWFLAGTNYATLSRLSYWDDSVVVMMGSDENKQEFAGSLSQGERGLLCGGISDYSESNIMVGTDAIRALDFTTDTWSFMHPFLAEQWARGASAKVGNLGYLIGGNRGGSWVATDSVTEIDLTTDTNINHPTILPLPVDLISAVTRDDGNIIISNSQQYYPTNGTCVVLASIQQFTSRFGSTFGAGAHEGILIGGKDQRYSDALVVGDVYSGGNSITDLEHVDYSNDTISTCPNSSPLGLTESAAVTPYSFCFPEGRCIGIMPCTLASYGEYATHLKTYVYKDYTYSDRNADCECQARHESDTICFTISVEEGVRDGIASAAETKAGGYHAFVHNSVDPYNDDREANLSAVDTAINDLHTSIHWEQSGGSVNCFAKSLEAERLWSTRGGFLYSGGPFNDIRCTTAPVFQLSWDYQMIMPSLEIFSKTVNRGSLEKILEKSIFDDPNSIDIDSILKDLMSQYPNQRNVVYLVETKESTILNEDVLLYQAVDLNYLTLVLITSDPYFLFRISNEQDFNVISDKDYFVNGSRIIPMIFGAQIIRIEFEQPLPVGEKLTLSLKNREHSLLIRLINL